MASRVLIAEGDPQVRERLQSYLVGAGYDVAIATGAVTVEACLGEGGPPIDLVLLGVNPPGTDGLSLARELRARSEVGILLIAAHDDAHERLAGLESGADDYLVLSPDPRELLARAKNLIRRVQHACAPARPAPSGVRRFGQWRLDSARRRLIDAQGAESLLTQGEFQLLGVFLRHSGHTLSRDQLTDQLRNREWLPNDRSIDVLVGRLRRKLRDDPAEPELILTVHRAGYLFTAVPSEA